jgi:hypothetical protein
MGVVFRNQLNGTAPQRVIPDRSLETSSSTAHPCQNRLHRSSIAVLIRGFRPRNWRAIIQAAKHALLTVTTDDLANAFARCHDL